MKLIKSILIICYVAIVMFVTACLLKYDENKVSVFFDKAFVLVNSNDIRKCNKGDLLIIDKKNVSLNIGDYVVYYNKNDNIVLGGSITSFSKANDEYTYNIDDKVTIESKYIIGNVNLDNRYSVIGGILRFFESKYGYLLFVVFPILIAFIYEVYAIVKEVKVK